jgi:hypothetical protein
MRFAVNAAPQSDLEVLRVLTNDRDVYVFRPSSSERTLDPLQQPHRSVVDVLVEREPKSEYDTALQHPRIDPRVADGPEVDRVVLTQFLDGAIRENLARLEVVVGTKWELSPINREPIGVGSRV